jgi:DNA modification methylase
MPPSNVRLAVATKAKLAKNVLYFGDNLTILREREYFPDASIDLVYLDPPFNSQENYNLLYRNADGTPSEAQEVAFTDTWKWDTAAAASYSETLRRGGRVAEAMTAFKQLLGPSDTMAYLAMMSPRLVELHRVLKDTGSFYLHCDPSAGHYLKVLLDTVFGPENFRREIIWRSGWVSGFKAGANNWVRNHDTLFYYVKNAESDFTFNKDLAYVPHEKGYERRGGGENPKGVAMDDVWDDNELYSPWIKSFSKEKLGYATQKPRALLERIISVSSNEGDTVLDPFCGCGTTIAAAHRLNRRWLGIDVTYLAIALVRHRLAGSFGPAAAQTYDVVGAPGNVREAQALAAEDRHKFEWWALGLVAARPEKSDRKLGADRGVDGMLYLELPDDKVLKILIQVKSGHVQRDVVATLKGDMSRVGAEIGAVLTLEEPTRPMTQEALEAGEYQPPGVGWEKAAYPKVQIRTIGDLLSGKMLDLPRSRTLTYLTPDRLPRSSPSGKVRSLKEDFDKE